MDEIERAVKATFEALEIGYEAGKNTKAKEETSEIKMKDISLPLGSVVEVMTNGRVVWVNGKDSCIVRICGLKDVSVVDLRKVQEDD